VARFGVSKPLAGVIVGLTALVVGWGGAAYADPEQDSVAKFNELSRQAEQLSQTIRNAQPDLDKKLQLLREADQKQADDLAALQATEVQLATYQGAVDQFAAAVYMGGQVDDFNAILTAASPANLIDKLAIERVVGAEMAGHLHGLRRVNQEAQSIAAASARSAAEARAAVDAAVAVRDNIQNKQAELRTRIAAVNASYAMLPPAQQAVSNAPSAEMMAALGPIGPIPSVGMGGLVPNAKSLAAYIMATYPGVQSIGGVRADALPDHPSGHAIDIMIGSNMGLGDAIRADLQNQAARFGISYTMWRVASHFDHVHVTVH